MTAPQSPRGGSNSWVRVRPRALRRGVLVLATAVGAVAVMAGSALSANTGSATLSNGAQLAVSIASPPTGTEYVGTSVDVPVTGTASIGLGEADATIIYVMDFSGSTGNSGGACGTILDCEKTFFVGLNAAAVADGSTDEVAVVKFDSSSSLALGLTNPTSAAVNTAINSGGPGSGTNCAAGLSEALTQVNATTNGTKIVVFASDGLCNAGANVSGPAGDLATAGAIVQSIAIGAGSSCSSDGGTGTLNQIAQNGGACHEVPDPNNLPNLIQSLIGSTLESLTLTVDGNASAIPNTEISLALPRPGATNVTYATTAQDLAPGAHEICVTAAGSDVLGDSKTAQGCVTVQVVNLTATPATETNELGSDNQHTVTATIAGRPVSSGRTARELRGRRNERRRNRDLQPRRLQVQRGRSGQLHLHGAKGRLEPRHRLDRSIRPTGNTTRNDQPSTWQRSGGNHPPVLKCTPSVNPDGKNVPGGSNEDGFYLLTATDTVTASRTS